MLQAALGFTVRGFDAGCKDKGVKAAGAGLGTGQLGYWLWIWGMFNS